MNDIKELKDEELAKITGGDITEGAIQYVVNATDRFWIDDNHNWYYEANENKAFTSEDRGAVSCKYVNCVDNQPNNILKTENQAKQVAYIKIIELITGSKKIN